MAITGKNHAQRIGNNGLSGRAEITNVGDSIGWLQVDAEAMPHTSKPVRVGESFIVPFKQFVSVVGINAKFQVEII
jgi:hypothetical protein